MQKTILQKILAILARAMIRKYKPKIIGITGSVGKTSTKEAIFAVLKTKYSVRTSEKNYNNEIGLPLTILGISHHGRNMLKWCSAFFGVFFSVFLRQNKYPEILVLEYGIDRPRDMNFLLNIAKSDIGVVTAIGDIPVHVEYFKSPEDLIKEKAKLIKFLPPDGFAVLNRDDSAVYDMKEKTKARVITYGFKEDAEIKISNYHLQIVKDATIGDVPEGITFKIERGSHLVPFRLASCFGEPQAYASAAATAVGVVLGMNLVEVSDALRDFVPPPGRLRLIKGIKHSYIIDDTYNAAPVAMQKALDTLVSLPGRRKIAVLGDMLEIGKYTETAHRAIGSRIPGVADILITVGVRAKFIAEEALAVIKPMSREKVMSFDDARSAGRALDSILRAGDLVLVKGSQGMRMEFVVEEIMAEPERAGELLVRQEEYWKK